MKKALSWLLLGSMLAAVAGCRAAQRQPTGPVAPPPVPYQVKPAAPPPVAPGAFPVAPASPYPAAPPSTFFPTVPPAPPSPGGNPVPLAPVPPPAPAPGGGDLPPAARVEYRWQPSESKVQLGGPEPITGQGGTGDAKLYPPENGENNTSEPPLVKIQSATALPVGIPQFALARDHVSAGLRPSLDDGLDWLKAKGYRMVLHVRRPGEEDNADRKQVEKRGLKYVALEVSPQTLTKMTVDEFNRIVRDVSGQPLFVYDRDGSLAGALWYLHFRTVEQFADDVARIRARGLGFREDQDGPHRDMWLAVQKYLNDNER